MTLQEAIEARHSVRAYKNVHTYADVAGISEEAAMNIAGAFGGGMAAWKERVARLLVQDLSLAWSIRIRPSR